jgi:hypothetical protein
MKMQLPKQMKASLVAFALQLAIVASAHAGGPTILQLPIEGVTEENSHQCAKLFEEKFGPVLINWKNGDVRIIKDGSTNLVALRPDRGQISLAEVEKVIEGSPFSIRREQLEYFSLVRLRIGKVPNHEKHIKGLASLDGKKLQAQYVENKDGSLWITLRDTARNTAISFPEKRKRSLVSHKRLMKHLSENKIELLEISWGCRQEIDHRLSWSDGSSGTRPELWRGDYFGARIAAAEVEVEGKKPKN